MGEKLQAENMNTNCEFLWNFFFFLDGTESIILASKKIILAKNLFWMSCKLRALIYTYT